MVERNGKIIKETSWEVKKRRRRKCAIIWLDEWHLLFVLSKKTKFTRHQLSVKQIDIHHSITTQFFVSLQVIMTSVSNKNRTTIFYTALFMVNFPIKFQVNIKEQHHCKFESFRTPNWRWLKRMAHKMKSQTKMDEKILDDEESEKSDLKPSQKQGRFNRPVGKEKQHLGWSNDSAAERMAVQWKGRSSLSDQSWTMCLDAPMSYTPDKCKCFPHWCPPTSLVSTKSKKDIFKEIFTFMKTDSYGDTYIVKYIQAPRM